MNLFSPTIIKELLIKHGARASKGLGQNFLIDKNVLEKIIKSADIKPNDIILEVGPGIGTLTTELAKRAKQVVAIEKDKKMCEILKETMKDYKNIEIIQADIRRYQPLSANYKLVANIPYYLTSLLIRKFLEEPKGYSPSDMVLMVQKEVAQRICAKTPNMSLLAISVQFYANAKIISYVSKNCFWPSPKVDSAIIKLEPHNLKYETDVSLFFKIVKAGFSHPRKQLVNNLTTLKASNGVKLTKEQISNWLLENNIKPNQRPETLLVSDWQNLTKTLWQKT